MLFRGIKRGTLLFLFFIFIASCSTPKYWSYRSIDLRCPNERWSELTFSPNCLYTGIELKFLKGDFGIKSTLGVYTRSIPPIDQYPKFSSVWMIIEGQTHYFSAERMEGGQLLLLPDAATSLLFENLKNGNPVTIKLMGYQTEYFPGNFCEFCKKFCD